MLFLKEHVYLLISCAVNCEKYLNFASFYYINVKWQKEK